MESLDYWRLCDELTVVQAALLIVGQDPSGSNSDVENCSLANQPVGYIPARAALINSIATNDLPADGRNDHWDRGTDWAAYLIKVADLKIWLSKRGIKTGFFFPDIESNTADYLDETHPSYSAKLAAAVAVWQAATINPDMAKSKSLKESMKKWLRTHAPHFNLIKPDGKLNENGITEVAKIANWKIEGGAPKQS